MNTVTPMGVNLLNAMYLCRAHGLSMNEIDLFIFKLRCDELLRPGFSVQSDLDQVVSLIS